VILKQYCEVVTIVNLDQGETPIFYLVDLVSLSCSKCQFQTEHENNNIKRMEVNK